MAFKVTIKSDLNASLKAAIMELETLDTAREHIKRACHDLMGETFDAEGIPAWKPNDPAYKRRKKGAPVGVYLGWLLESLAHGNSRTIFNMNRSRIQFGTNWPHAANFSRKRPLFSRLQSQDGSQFIADVLATVVASKISIPQRISAKIRGFFGGIFGRGRR